MWDSRKNLFTVGTASGADLVELMQAQRHRGSDSTGFGMYGQRRDRGYVVRVVADDRTAALGSS